MTPIIMIFGFLFILIFILTSEPIKRRIKNKIKFRIKEKTKLKLGLFFVFSAIIFVILGDLTNYTPYESYENGYLYVNEVALAAAIYLMIGLFFIVLWAGNKLRKFAHDRGYTVESQ